MSDIKGDVLAELNKMMFTYPTTQEEAEKWTSLFFINEPVTKVVDYIGGQRVPYNVGFQRMINKNLKSGDDVDAPRPYEWKSFDVNNDDDMNNIVEFMNKQYRHDGKYNIIFTREYIRWLLLCGKSSYAFGIVSNGKIGGILLGAICNMQLFYETRDTLNVYYICVHSKLRNKKVGIAMMKKAKNDMLKNDVQVGFYGTKVYSSKPVYRATYYYRPINYKKLVDCEFIMYPELSDMDNLIYEHQVRYTPHETVPLSEDNVDRVYDLYVRYRRKYNISDNLSIDEFKKMYMNSNFVHSYVIVKNNVPIDFFSMYYYECTKNENVVKCAKLHTYTSVNATPFGIYKTFAVIAKDNNVDMLVLLGIMENEKLVCDGISKLSESLNYGHYIFYNWECRELLSEQIYKDIPLLQ